MFAGAFMMGAKDRLLPPSVPFRFFATALIMHVLGWVALLAGADDLPRFFGGFGWPLAGLHLMTLGVLAMTAMGAAFQLLPVATSRQLGPAWACRLAWWLFAPGIAALSLGLGTGWTAPLHGGGTLVAAALVIFAVLVGRNLLQVSDLPGITRHAWVALASLVGLAVLGLLLLVDFKLGFLPARANVAAAHAVLAGYGFMGSFALGFSYVLVPMFVLSQGVPDATGKRTAALTALAVALGTLGAGFALDWLAALGCAVGLAAVWVHLRALLKVLKTRMRKRLETFFRLIGLAWVMLPLTLVAGMAVALGLVPEVMVPLWGWLLIFGWLLTFVTGILQRIMPFLASMHSGGNGGKPALMSRLVAERPLLIHAILHGAALVLVAAGMVANSPLLVRLGTLSGLAGALFLILFAALLMRRYFAHERQNAKGNA